MSTLAETSSDIIAAFLLNLVLWCRQCTISMWGCRFATAGTDQKKYIKENVNPKSASILILICFN